MTSTAVSADATSGRPAEATFCLLLALASMVGLALGAMAP